MPFKSQAQEKYFFANRPALEKQGVNVAEWASASKGMSLPKYAKGNGPTKGAGHGFGKKKPFGGGPYGRP